MDPETMAVPSSDVPVSTMEEAPEAAPSSEPTPEAPAPVEPAPAAEPNVYELPDGRKLDGAAIAQEYKNLLTDYTKKSQALAEKERGPLPDKPANPFSDPNYTPQSWEEVAQQMEARFLEKIEARTAAEIAQRQALEDQVSSELTEIKKADPTLNENTLFLHATKYGFRDLKAAYSNMRDMNEMAKKVQATTAQNIAKRNDPVSVSPGAPTGARPDPANFSSAIDYLRSLK